MSNMVLVNLHCHSLFSDGDLSPEILVGNLAAAGVRFASLTDHDTLEGLPRFKVAIEKHGMACLPGVELTTWFNGREVHLLGYGFNPADSVLTANLISLRQTRELQVQSIAGSLRKMGTNHHAAFSKKIDQSTAVNGKFQIEEAISMIHHAGGQVFLAHPFQFELDQVLLEKSVVELISKGLDGIEADYYPSTAAQRAYLHQLAEKYDLLVSAGTDFHNANAPGNNVYGIEMPKADWVLFREKVFLSPIFSSDSSSVSNLTHNDQNEGGKSTTKPYHFQRRYYIVRIFLPTIIAIGLFLAAIWGIIFPSFEQSLLDRKRELIRELTNSALSILDSYEREEQNGLLSRDEAQELAIERIETLRYGPEGKDYFWIQDLQPRMIMHPYRSDLNGKDLTEFTDARGVQIFVEFADLVRRDGEGYIDYVWQWKDDPQRLEPKESFVKGFEPWGWLIGTGIYTDDVSVEIARIERSISNTSLIISGVVIFLLLFVMLQSLRIEREKQEVVDSLRDSTERYHKLAEATTEGTLLITDGRCRYANPTFLNMTGYSSRQLEFLELDDLLPKGEGNEGIWERFENLLIKPVTESGVFDGFLKHADGTFLDCAVALNPIDYAGQNGFILLVRDLVRQSAILNEQAISHAAQVVPVGIFRARAARQGVMLEMNPATRSMLENLSNPQPTLADLFSNSADYEAFFKTLQDSGEIKDYVIRFEAGNASVLVFSLSACLVRDERKNTSYIDGSLIDITSVKKKEAVREAVIEKLQTSLLFLHEPISKLGRDVLICNMDTSIGQLSRMMTARNVTAALVSSGDSSVIGIVTDHDLRARVLSENVLVQSPIHTIMSAPLTKIPEDAMIYEALLRMEEKGVRHLAVEDHNGQIVSVIDNKSLIQFHRYGPIVLTREISRAVSPEEVTLCIDRVPPLVKTLLDNSARPRNVTNMLASVCDAATGRLVQLAIEEMGAPPAPFAFIAMGSQGRQEQTLVTDQDNGIIYSQPEQGDSHEIGDYFLRLGERVCVSLSQAGYPFCHGQVMANNPRWCRSLADWVSGFKQWIREPELQEIINLSIFFDFRTVFGEPNLAQELHRQIHTVLTEDPSLFRLFAQNAMTFKPPFRLLGNIYVGGGSTEHAGEINLKDAMMPLVNFARLYALRHQLNQTHTLERIEALTERNIILPTSRDEMITSYDFLMQLRLQNQVVTIQDGRAPTNNIQPSKLGYIQQELLKQAFAQISAAQKKISYDFLGGE